MCRVPAEAMPVLRCAVPLCRALSGLRGARPPRAVTHTEPHPAGSRAELSPRCHPWRCAGCVCVSVRVRTPRGRVGQCGGRRAGRMPSAYGRLWGCVPCDIGTFTQRLRHGRPVPPSLAAGSTSPQRDFALVLVFVEASPVCLANPEHAACASGAQQLSAVRFSGGVSRESILLGRNRPSSDRGTILGGRPVQGQCYRQGVTRGKGEFWFGGKFISV